MLRGKACGLHCAAVCNLMLPDGDRVGLTLGGCCIARESEGGVWTKFGDVFYLQAGANEQTRCADIVSGPVFIGTWSSAEKGATWAGGWRCQCCRE